MISVICTQCRAQLEMDDAFAGGVCRCQFCGTIQTVPSLTKLKRQSAPSAVGPAAAGSYAAPPGAPASPQPHAAGNGHPAPADELDALAAAVATSSGLGRGSLRSGGSHVQPVPGGPDSAPAPLTIPAQPAPAPVDYARPAVQSRRPIVLILAAVGITLLLVVLGVLFVATPRFSVVTPAPPVRAQGSPNAGNPFTPGRSDDNPQDVPIPTGPHFCGVSLKDVPSVVYVIDRGSATAEMFDTLKEATYRSIDSLAVNQEFAVIFWAGGDEEAGPPRYPEHGLAEALPPATQAVPERFRELYTGGRSDPEPALRAAAALRPSVIVLVTVTAKAADLDDKLVAQTKQAVSGSGTKVHTFVLGTGDDHGVLRKIAEATGGEANVLTKGQLKAYSDDPATGR